MRIFLFIALLFSTLTFGGFFYLSYAAQHASGGNSQVQRFEVKQGEGMFSLGERLEAAGLISSRYVFLWHLVRVEKTHNLVAGTYSLSGEMSVAGIALVITEGKTVSRDVRITFPEGWNSKKMAERLTANGLPGASFLRLVEKPQPELRNQFDFLSALPIGATLEGFLFPDTYFFDPQTSAEAIVEKMLTNFGKKFDSALRMAAEKQKRSLFATVTLASIVENEVKTETDRKIVADIFSRRLAIGQALQSCATLQYILGVDRVQYSYAETQTPSPYNTYINPGLPPGPIGNPGLMTLNATISPQANPYFYFLNDPKTGETIFSITYEEHLKNKSLHGL
ncbi:MAG: endolytic transglycosylase MltG [Candidatus Moranbacteria bacterium]|nr:endolytic transglycosylase MltG [Candidatus Moranbacteria bacterium]